MKTLTLSVTVEGGLSQLGLYYKLVKNGQESKTIKEAGSFQKTFTNLDGDYTLYIGGSNADSDKRKTSIKLIYDDADITLDKELSYSNPSVQKGRHIYAEYYFKA